MALTHGDTRIVSTGQSAGWQVRTWDARVGAWRTAEYRTRQEARTAVQTTREWRRLGMMDLHADLAQCGDIED